MNQITGGPPESRGLPFSAVPASLPAPSATLPRREPEPRDNCAARGARTPREARRRCRCSAADRLPAGARAQVSQEAARGYSGSVARKREAEGFNRTQTPGPSIRARGAGRGSSSLSRRAGTDRMSGAPPADAQEERVGAPRSMQPNLAEPLLLFTRELLEPGHGAGAGLSRHAPAGPGSSDNAYWRGAFRARDRDFRASRSGAP